MLPVVKRLPVVGIGADGWSGLDPLRRERIQDAEVIIGGRRHLTMLPDTVHAERRTWPSPLRSRLPEFLEQYRGRRLLVLASGDPMFFGIGTMLIELIGPDELEILPGPSALSLACARMGWPVQDVDVVSVVGRELHRVAGHLVPDGKVLVLSEDATTPQRVAALVNDAGFGDSKMTVLADLGSPSETVVSGVARTWNHPAGSDLNVVAIDCVAHDQSLMATAVAGRDDALFYNDGQLTKRDVRASALARLAPVPGQLLWDVGAGAGSVAIEWMRADRRCRAIAIESQPARADRIRENARVHGVPGLSVTEGSAPGALVGLEPPDAVFIGGGATTEGMLPACWDALLPGGRLVVHGVTLETERLLLEQFAQHGGELARLNVEQAEALGTFTAWKPARPIIQWFSTKAAIAESLRHTQQEEP